MNEQIAKLLATEDINVVTANVKTASFELKTRTLTLPMWEDMNKDTEDLLTGHEVGHALYTPLEEWQEAVKEKPKAFHGFVNIVEDARIEKKIQVRYPGLRRSFIKGYKKMLADGFFGGDINYINDLSLIDRINCRFKLGLLSGVNFTNEEKPYVDMVDAVVTFDDAVEVAEVLYQKAREDKEKENEENQAREDALNEEMESESGEGDSFEDFDMDDMMGDFGGEESEDEESDSEDSDLDEESQSDCSGSGEESEDEGEESDEETKGSTTGEGKQSDDGNDDIDDSIESRTDEELRKNIEAEYSNDFDGEIHNIELTMDRDNLIHGYKKVLEDSGDNFLMGEFLNGLYLESQERWAENFNSGVDDAQEAFAREVDYLYNTYMTNNKKSISYLVKEFELRKAATEYARTTVSKTGVIDPVKMNSYHFTDDIFRKMNVVHDGKNHGMIMYLDWSGSMSRDLFATIEQTLNLVYFCKAVNIPFRVFAFTDGWMYTDENGRPTYSDSEFEVDPNHTGILTDGRYKLIEFFNNRMNKRQLTKMTKNVLALGKWSGRARPGYGLHATPLDVTIVAAIGIHDKFKKANRVDIVNTIFLTDGVSHGFQGRSTAGMVNLESVWRGYASTQIVNIIDPVTKQKFRLNRSVDSGSELTEQWLKIYKAHTGSNLIGFRIVPNRKNQFRSEMRDLGVRDYEVDEIHAKLRKENYCAIPSKGYDRYFAIPNGKNLESNDGSFEVDQGATRGKIATAFKKARKGKLSSRAMLNEFVANIAA